MNVILTDVDGVLLNWQGAFDAWMMREHGLFATGNERAYMQGTRFEMSEPEIKKYIRSFNASANIGFLPPLFDAVKGVKKLHDEYGYKFLVITSLSLNPFAQKLRTQNLEAIFGAHVLRNLSISILVQIRLRSLNAMHIYIPMRIGLKTRLPMQLMVVLQV